MILVVCAVAAELRGFAREGVEIAAVGVGPVEAALATARALGAAPYELVVNAGIGGGFGGRAAVGDAIVVSGESYVEIGREDGGQLTLPDGLKLVDTVAADAALLELVGASRLPAGLRIGTGVTSATITTSAARAELLARRYGPAVESMEGFAVLRAAVAFGVATLEVRGISNIVGDRTTSQWDFRAGSAAAVRALTAILDVVNITT